VSVIVSVVAAAVSTGTGTVAGDGAFSAGAVQPGIAQHRQSSRAPAVSSLVSSIRTVRRIVFTAAIMLFFIASLGYNPQCGHAISSGDLSLSEKAIYTIQPNAE
jgi:hypothetical protein